MIVLSVSLFPGESIDVHFGYYYNYAICLSMIFLGIFILFACGIKYQFSNNFLVFVGQNTLVFYILSNIVIGFILKVLLFLGICPVIDNYIFFGLTKLCMACVGCSIISIVLNKYCPIAVGKKKKKMI